MSPYRLLTLAILLLPCSFAAPPSITPWNIITTVAGNGTAGYSGDGVDATSVKISNPRGIFVDTLGNIYIADCSNNRIRKIDTSGTITTIAGTGTAGYSGDGGLATAAMLNSPRGLYVDHSNNVYIADGNNCIRFLDGTTGNISTFAGNGTGGYTGDGGPATSAQLNLPFGVYGDPFGNIYITDTNNHVIRSVNTSGIINSFAGNGTGGYSGDGGVATSSEINSPKNAVSDNLGNIYIADFSNNRIRKVNASNSIITTVAGNGIGGFSGDGGAATSTQIYKPQGVAVDSIGNIYIPDSNNNRIRKVNTSGIITTVVGDGTAAFSGDGGAAISAEINNPFDTFVDSLGNLYFSDNSNSRIRKVLVDQINISSSTGAISLDANATYTAMDGVAGSQIDLNGYLLTFGKISQANSSVFNGTIIDSVGGGTLTTTGTGTLTLSGTNSYAGSTTLNTGTLALSGAGSIASSSGVTLNGTSTFDISGTASGTTINDLTSTSATATVALGSKPLTLGTTNSTTYAGTVTGTGSLTKQGTGTFTLTGNNTYSGGTTGSAGTLAVGSHTALGSGALKLSGATLQAAATVSLNNPITLDSPVTIDTQTNNMTLLGVLSETVKHSLAKQGTGILTLGGINTYTGSTNIYSGTFALTGSGSVSSSNKIALNGTNTTFDIAGITAGTTIQDLSSTATPATVALGSKNLTFGTSNNQTYTGSFTGTGGLIKQGSGTQTLSSASPSYSGTTTINAGTIAMSNNQALGTGSVSLNGGTLQAAATLTGASSVANAMNVAASSTVDANGNAMTLSGILSGSNPLSLINSNTSTSGTLAFAGANTYGGTLTATSAVQPLSLTLLPGGNLTHASLNLNTNITFANSSGVDQTIQDLTGSAGSTIALESNNLTAGTSTNTTFAGIMTGVGGFSKAGSGTMTLSGNNAYTGVTTITGGTLTLSGAGSITPSSGVRLAANTTLNTSAATTPMISNLSSAALSSTLVLGSNLLTLNTTSPTTFAGSITGAGAMNITGSSTLTLSGANTSYSGTTTLDAGTLAITNNQALGTGSVKLNGGTLQMSAPLSLSNALQVSASSTLDTQATTLTHTGSLTGTGALNKQGIGTWVLQGSGSYSGPLTVTQGTLQVLGTYASVDVTVLTKVMGTGTLGSLTNQGIVAPGNSPGTLTINGNYTEISGSTLNMTMTPTACSQLIVNGTATLAGTLYLTATPGTYPANTTFTLVTASNLTGNFSSITKSAPFDVVATVDNGAYTVTIDLPHTFSINNNGTLDTVATTLQTQVNTAISDTTLATTPQATAAASIVAPLSTLFQNTSDTAAIAAVNSLSSASTQTVVQTLSTLSGQEKAVIPKVMDMTLTGLHETLNTHLSQSGSLPESPAAEVSQSFWDQGQKMHQEIESAKEAFFETQVAAPNLTPHKKEAVQPLQGNVRLTPTDTLWSQVGGATYHQDQVGSDLGVMAKTAKLTMGYDRQLTPCFKLGVTAAGSRMGYDITGGVTTGSVQSTFGGAYGHYKHKQVTLQGSFLAGTHRFFQERLITFPTLSYTARSTHPGTSLSGQLKANYTHAFKNGFQLTPSLRGSYLWLKQQDFNETGAGSFNLSYQSSIGRIVQGEVDLLAGKPYLYQDTLIHPQVGVGYLHTRQLGNTNTLSAAFAGVSGTTFVQKNGRNDLNFSTAKANLTATHQEGYAVGLHYATKLNNRTFAQEGFMKVSLKM